MKSDSKKFLPLLLIAGAAFLGLGAKSISRFKLPLKGKVTSGFGDRINPVTKVKEHHNGIDIAVPEGTSVISPEAGEVLNVYQNAIGGNQIVVKHKDGYITGYAHLSAPLVNIKDKVSRGQMIALSGRTGQVTGPHLHFSLRDPSGKYIDPESVFNFS